MDEDGSVLPQGAVGEVVIRGPSVTKGYEANPEANAKAFTNGWFRTGDQGMLDEDGYLQLTGRLKELIKRGGEQVSPLEVDGVLSEHPAVAQALTFSIPHPMLGEEVGAAVVLREGMTLHGARAARLRGEAARRLQGAAQGGVPAGDPEGRDGQAPAHRPGGEARDRSVAMKLCVYGAGAIGGLLGARLAQKGEVDVTFIARGPHLAAMQADGVTLVSGGERVTVRPRCVATAEEAGPQDYVLVTLKAHSLPGGGAADAAAARAGHRRGLGRERRALVVLLQARRPLGGPAGGERRPGRQALGAAASRRAPSAASSTRRPR